MKNKFFSILLNPYFIAAIISLIIIYLLPNYFSKYKFELKENTYIQQNTRVHFPDLNNNGISEKMISGIRGNENSSFILYDDKGDLVDQWNFSENLASSLNKYWFLDTDTNGFKEIYFVTRKSDSLFLNILNVFFEKRTKKKIFIDVFNKRNKKFSCGLDGVFLSNNKIDGIKEFYFTLNQGFGGNPRNTYKFNSKTNLIKKSVHLTNVSVISGFEDINDDGFEEIMFKSGSYGNEIDSIFTMRTDNSLWLNVLDHQLNFLFKPVEIKVPFSRLKVLPYTSDGEFKLICLLNSDHKQTSKSKLIVYSIRGDLIKEKEIPKGLHDLFLNSIKDGILLFNTNNGQIKKLNFDLEEMSSVTLAKNSELFEIDINEDGKTEWLNTSKNKSKLIFYDHQFIEGHTFEFENFNATKFFYGIKKTAQGNRLYIQNGDYYYIFSYTKNPYYLAKFLIYPVVYLLILGLVMLIIKGQNIRIEKKLVIEKEIAELQIKTIKNQVDPHFVFNAINTISGLILTDRKLEADEFICNFSEFMRGTLNNSNKITCTIQKEIAFVEKYIQLQQVRFNKCFEYKITIDKKVNLSEMIPKHVLYSYVENAIKHGVCTKQNGLLKISIEFINNNLVLCIEDNGGGFDAIKRTKKNSTGNGMLIMEEMYSLYAKLYKKRINHKIEEILNDEKVAIGVRVSVFITS